MALVQCSAKPQPVQYKYIAGQCIIRYNALTVVSAAVLYMYYSTHDAFELPTQCGTL